ncbi:hypothetical protein K1719_009798 [Acacia pycnantha]|nr:hypothetical protein K1719_009798 [Acacia pycnantha]
MKSLPSYISSTTSSQFLTPSLRASLNLSHAAISKLHIKAIVTAEEVLLRDPMDDDVIPIVQQLQRMLPKEAVTGQGQGEEEETCTQEVEGDEENEFPLEFRATAVRVACEAICTLLGERARELEAATYPALDDPTSKMIKSLVRESFFYLVYILATFKWKNIRT